MKVNVLIIIAQGEVELNKKFFLDKIRWLTENGCSVTVISDEINVKKELDKYGVTYYECYWIKNAIKSDCDREIILRLSIMADIIRKNSINIIEADELQGAIYAFYLSQIIKIPFNTYILNKNQIDLWTGKYYSLLKILNNKNSLFVLNDDIKNEIEKRNDIAIKVVGDKEIDLTMKKWMNVCKETMDNYIVDPKEMFINYCSINSYSLQKFEENNKMKFLDNDGKKLVLFGASKFGEDFYKVLENQNVVKFFCDNDSKKWGEYINDVPIISPKQLKDMKSEVKVLITSMYHDEIKLQLEKMGIENINYIENINAIRFARFYRSSPLVMKDHINDIFKVLNILEDYNSKQIYMNILMHKLNLDFNLLYSVAECNENQYFDEEIIKLGNREIFIDAGAYVGDTMKSFIHKTKGKFDKIYSFEPDKKNYNRLLKNIKDSKYSDKVVPVNGGVYDKTTTLSFYDGLEGASSISDQGVKKVNVYSLDEYLKDTPVTFIKMDVEGSEYSAIMGAKKIITKLKPKLAICVYHKIEDMWQIPLLIKSIVPEYKLYIRHYSYDMCETVCYAVL
ncbi:MULTISPECIES: FkbM family methyltransferase [Clostridium]|uniref:FkbM family methyltransferase n=1 Tax=Clostridium TaxID=1485 RepID=UPI000824AEC3|nr:MULTISPECIES: FkbM family methyltransferase [Clostridium]PJI09846.1 FkbM family methyltransferase [Clostridium sp. CT7]